MLPDEAFDFSSTWCYRHHAYPAAQMDPLAQKLSLAAYDVPLLWNFGLHMVQIPPCAAVDDLLLLKESSLSLLHGP